MMTTQVMMAS